MLKYVVTQTTQGGALVVAEVVWNSSISIKNHQMLTYQPDKGVSLGDILILWGMERQHVRELLKGEFEINDQVIDLSQYNNGDKSQNIIQRRDIYKNYNNAVNSFFLHFDREDRLSEIEVHHGLKIIITSISIDFTMNIDQVVRILDQISKEKHQLSDGEYFYDQLKLTIASSEAMGGAGEKLSYVYLSKDVSHIIDK